MEKRQDTEVMEFDISELLKQFEEMRRNERRKEERFNEMSVTVEQLSGKCEQLETKVENLELSVSKKDSEVRELIIDNKNLLEQIVDLKTALLKKETENGELLVRVQGLIDELNEEKSAHGESKETIERLKIALKDRDTKIEVLENRNADWKKKKGSSKLSKFLIGSAIVSGFVATGLLGLGLGLTISIGAFLGLPIILIAAGGTLAIVGCAAAIAAYKTKNSGEEDYKLK